MTRFSKASCIFYVVGASLLLLFVLETRFINIPQWTPWNSTPNISGASDRPRHLCVHFSGRLGNQMFIFASAYGIARTANRTLVATGNTLLHHFDGIPPYKGPADCYRRPPIKEKRACAFDPHIMTTSANDSDVLLSRYFQSWMYFKNYAADIRRMFTFKRKILVGAQTILKEAKLRYLAESGAHGINLTIIGVHVRRGDMLSKGLMKHGYRTATLQYYLHAMDYFTRKFPDVLFVVCSDDIAWCKRNLQFQKNIRVVTSGLPAVDMAILSLCNHTISSTGTFSWWSAWLAGGQTTYFAHPAFEGTPLRKEFSKNLSDYFWPGWIPLS